MMLTRILVRHRRVKHVTVQRSSLIQRQMVMETVCQWDDCDDADPEIGAAPEGETCDGPEIIINPAPDGDGDGVPEWDDCDDADPEIGAAPEGEECPEPPPPPTCEEKTRIASSIQRQMVMETAYPSGTIVMIQILRLVQHPKAKNAPSRHHHVRGRPKLHH